MAHRTATVSKGNKTLTRGQKVAKTKPKNQKPKVDLNLPHSDYTDCHGRTYCHDPNAKAPYTGHSIRYPNAVEDENIPFQIGEETDDINGASDILIALALLKNLEKEDSPHILAARLFFEAGAKCLLAEDVLNTDLFKHYTTEQQHQFKFDLTAVKLLNASDTLQRVLISLRDKSITLGKQYEDAAAVYVSADAEVPDEIEPMLKYVGAYLDGKTT